MMKLSRAEALKRVLSACQYNPETGEITSSDPGVKVGKQYPFIVVRCGGKTFRGHRIAAMLQGHELGYLVDVHHINFNPSDNRWSNLQVLSRSAHKKLHIELQQRADNIQLHKCRCEVNERGLSCAECERAKIRVQNYYRGRRFGPRIARDIGPPANPFAP